MDPIVLIAAIGGPLSGIIIALVADHRSKRNLHATNQVELKTIEVCEKEAHTHEIAVIIEGFTTSLENMRTDLQDTRAELTATKTELTATREELRRTREDHSKLRDRVDQSDIERDLMIRHITDLEALVPNPPGPPTRPAAWAL